MSDPFEASLEATEADAGPFRTGEPTRERKLERAREESFERVHQATADAIRRDARRVRWRTRALYAMTAVFGLALASVVALTALNVRGASAWFCPALAALISSGLVAWKSRALTDAMSRPRDPG